MGKCLFMNFMDLVIVFKFCEILLYLLYCIIYYMFYILFVFFIDFFGIGLFVLWYDEVDF